MCGLIGIVTAHDTGDREKYTRELFEILIPGLKYLKRRGPESFGAGFVNPHTKTVGRRAYTTPLNEALTAELKRMAFDIRASIALGQTRWLTDYDKGGRVDKAVRDANAQPIHLFFDGLHGFTDEALGIHNGNIPKSEKEKIKLALTHPSKSEATVDSRFLTEMYMQMIREIGDEWDAAKWIMENIEGAFTFGYTQGDNLIFFKDKRGFRPLCLGRTGNSIVAVSESGFIEEMGMEFIREVEPGEMIRINADGSLESRVLVDAEHAHCIFEDIYFKDYFSRSNNESVSVTEVRKRIGSALFMKYNGLLPNRDYVVSFAPESGKSYAYGFAAAAEKMVDELLRKPKIDAAERHFLTRAGHKYVPNTPVIRGNNIIILDDSIMRGDSVVKMYQVLKDAGAKKIYFFSAWPLNLFHCDKGIDTPTDDELIAHRLIEEGLVKKHNGTEAQYDQNQVNVRMTEIIREDIRQRLGSGYNPQDLSIFYGTKEILRDNLPTTDNCEFCITGIAPEANDSKTGI